AFDGRVRPRSSVAMPMSSSVFAPVTVCSSPMSSTLRSHSRRSVGTRVCVFIVVATAKLLRRNQPRMVIPFRAVTIATDVYELARKVLTPIAHPVSITASAHAGERSCGTSTLMYVSHAPPMVAIAEHPGSRTARLIRESKEFSVSLLHDSQQDIAAAAGKSAPGPDKLATLKIRAIEAPAG